MKPKQRQRLLNLIDEACTNKQISALLRAKKHEGGKVKISGTSMQLMGHLRDAKKSGYLSDDDLIRLLAEGEENGRQHIFLYRLMPQRRSQYSDTGKVYQRLLDAAGATADSLPKFVMDPAERTLSDIRLQALKNNKNNILIKWYASRRVERVTDEKKIERYGDEFILREIKVEQVRLVSLARLHPRGLLEVRVPTGLRESRKTCEEEVEQMWESIEAVLNRDHFNPLGLTKAMKWLVDNDGKRNAKHRVSVAQAADGDGRAEFNPGMEGESLFNLHRHREAIKKYEDFARMDAYWKSPLAGASDDDEIRCQMAPYDAHGFRIGSKRTPEEVDFVVNRLWELSK